MPRNDKIGHDWSQMGRALIARFRSRHCEKCLNLLRDLRIKTGATNEREENVPNIGLGQMARNRGKAEVVLGNIT